MKKVLISTTLVGLVASVTVTPMLTVTAKALDRNGNCGRRM
jgi:hypothetical protein